jgi:hypothetical protein
MSRQRAKRKGAIACRVRCHCLVRCCPPPLSSKGKAACGNGRSPLNGATVRSWCCCARPIPSSPRGVRLPRCTAIPTPGGTGGGAGPWGRSAWPRRRGADARAGFPPLAHALVKAGAGEAVHHRGWPLRRRATTALAAQARQARGTASSPSPVWRSLAAAALKPWRYQ